MPSPAAPSTGPPSLIRVSIPGLSATALEGVRRSPAGSSQIRYVPDPWRSGPNPVGHRRNRPRCHPLPSKIGSHNIRIPILLRWGLFRVDALSVVGMPSTPPNSPSITGVWRDCHSIGDISVFRPESSRHLRGGAAAQCYLGLQRVIDCGEHCRTIISRRTIVFPHCWGPIVPARKIFHFPSMYYNRKMAIFKAF